MSATANQTRYFRGLFAEAGIPLSSTRLKRFKALTSTEARTAISSAQEEVALYGIAAYRAPHGMATAAQLSYFMNLSRRLGTPVTDESIEAHKLLSTEAMQKVNNDIMRCLQDRNDAHGVPLPAWRLERGLYDSDTLREGQRAAAARQAARRAEIEAQILHRQQQRPIKRKSIAYPGEAGHL